MSKKVGLISLGCPKNLVDSEIMLGILEDAGYSITTDASSAEIIIINTCGFIQDAKEESIVTILETAQLKKNGNLRYLVVTGCLPQRYDKDLASLLPEVDLFVGVGEYSKISEFLSDINFDKMDTSATKLKIGIPEYIHSSKTPRKLSTPDYLAYVKIAEGCFHSCSFCAIPMIRGKFRSRKLKDIKSEIKDLVKTGVKEIILIAQDTTSYAKDLSVKYGITDLLEEAALLSENGWIRLMYTYPQSFDKKIVEIMKKYSNICRYIDMPIQHIDNKILSEMRRGCSGKIVKETIEYIKSSIPEIALRTSVITGFPGESDADFQKLADFISKGYFDHLGVFTFSPEEGTKAADMNNQIPNKVKNERRDEIMKIQKEVSRKKLESYVGRKIKVLIEGPSKETDLLWQGRAEFQATDIDGVVYINEGDFEAGSFYTVEINDSYDYDLLGRVVS